MDLHQVHIGGYEHCLSVKGSFCIHSVDEPLTRSIPVHVHYICSFSNVLKYCLEFETSLSLPACPETASDGILLFPRLMPTITTKQDSHLLFRGGTVDQRIRIHIFYDICPKFPAVLRASLRHTQFLGTQKANLHHHVQNRSPSTSIQAIA